MKVIFLLIIGIISPSILNAQQKRLKLPSPDSCHMEVYRVVTKEMAISENDVYERKLAASKLSNLHCKSLLKKLNRKSSYGYDRALLTHYNIVFKLFDKGFEQRVSISTLTGNIDIEYLVNGSIYYGSVSDKLGKWLILTLRTYHMIHLMDEHDLTGITN